MSGGSGISSGGGAQGDLSAMIALMADPAALKAQYAEFEARKKQADEVVSLVGPARDVLRLRDEAQKLKDQAEKALAAAKEKAAQLVADAQSQADQLASEAKADAAAAKAKSKALVDKASKVSADADLNAEAVKAAVASNGARANELQQREAALAVREAKLAEDEAALAAQAKALDDAAHAFKAQIVQLTA